MLHQETIESRANRFRVFSVVKRLMEETEQCPTATEVAKILGLSGTAVRGHMDALRHADGLPLPIPDGRIRMRRHSQAQMDDLHGVIANGHSATKDVVAFFSQNGAV